jgi:hypothetical protein
MNQQTAASLDPQTAQSDQEAGEEQENGEVVERAGGPEPDRGRPGEEQGQQRDRDRIPGWEAEPPEDEVEAESAAGRQQGGHEVKPGRVRAEHLVGADQENRQEGLAPQDVELPGERLGEAVVMPLPLKRPVIGVEAGVGDLPDDDQQPDSERRRDRGIRG